MMRFAAEAATHLPRAEIVELHNEAKLDAPSGTAKATAEAMGGDVADPLRPPARASSRTRRCCSAGRGSCSRSATTRSRARRTCPACCSLSTGCAGSPPGLTVGLDAILLVRESRSSSATSRRRRSTRSSTRPTRRCSAAAASTVRSSAREGPRSSPNAATLGGCETGDAKATGAGRLPARYVVHAVGPVWRGGDEGEAELLASAHRRSLEVADGLGCANDRLPRDLAGSTAIRPSRPRLSRWSPCSQLADGFDEVRFVFVDERLRALFASANSS